MFDVPDGPNFENASEADYDYYLRHTCGEDDAWILKNTYKNERDS